MRLDRAFLFRHPAHFLALGCGAGLSPVAPGTVGTLLAVPLFILMQPFGVAVVALSAVVLFAIGIWASEVTGRALGVADHGGIVIDEIAAFLLVLAAAPSGWLWGLLAFALFRVFDIVKPWPIRQAERAIKGGLGVMTDDLLAAVYAIAVLLLANAAVGA
ncbi:MAG TPA: phosphatidylglycerophosphatase A [Usitatibacteraceae bacterium]|nr:phosphatidylglycerophosphatase A [Usitatibacteraceae bacterium]